jgi:hypothetical protein
MPLRSHPRNECVRIAGTRAQVVIDVHSVGPVLLPGDRPEADLLDQKAQHAVLERELFRSAVDGLAQTDHTRGADGSPQRQKIFEFGMRVGRFEGHGMVRDPVGHALVRLAGEGRQR